MNALPISPFETMSESPAPAGEAQFAAIGEFSGDAIVGKTPEGIVTSWNLGAERIFGYTAVEAIGQSALFLIPPDRVHEERQVLARVARGERVDEFETVRLRKEGAAIAVWVSLAPIKDEHGRPIGISQIARDLTSRHREDEALRLSEVRYRRLFETAQDGILILDASTGQVVDANPFVQVLLGYAQGEFIGKKLWEIGPFKGIDASKTVFAELQLKDSVRYESLSLERPDGSRVEAELIGNAYVAAGRRLVQCNIRDLAARNRAERVLREKVADLSRLAAEVSNRTAELEATNRELESFSYAVSHDLRAPLRSIDGFSRILLEDYADKLDDEGKEHLQRVRTASQRMGHLIDDLLKLSHVTRLEMRRSPVNLSAVARDIADDLQRAEPERRVHWSLARDLSAQGDPHLVRAVLENLLGNAWKFTRDRTDARIELGLAEHGGAPAFFVRDNGAGFDLAFADKLFSPFHRLHSVTEFPGNGIGLATVQRIIRRHGGRVWAESELNRGATFWFTLPEPSNQP